MRGYKLLMFTAVAIPGMAMAQVGPNPAVPGGSQSPAVGGSSDMMTAPQDAQIGGRATGNVLDRSIDTRTDTTVGTSTPPRTGADVGTGTTGTTMGTGTAAGSGTTMDMGTATGTETRTQTRTKSTTTKRR